MLPTNGASNARRRTLHDSLSIVALTARAHIFMLSVRRPAMHLREDRCVIGGRLVRFRLTVPH